MSKTIISIGKKGYVTRHNGVITDYKEHKVVTKEDALRLMAPAVRKARATCDGGVLAIETEYYIVEENLLNYGNITKPYKNLIHQVQAELELCDAEVQVRTKKPATSTLTLKDIKSIKNQGTAKLGSLVTDEDEFETADSLLDAFSGLKDEEEL